MLVFNNQPTLCTDSSCILSYFELVMQLMTLSWKGAPLCLISQPTTDVWLLGGPHTLLLQLLCCCVLVARPGSYCGVSLCMRSGHADGRR